MLSQLTEIAHELVAKVKAAIKAVVDVVKEQISKLTTWGKG